MESKGVKVFSLAENNKEVDAYSFWKGGTPFIFINTIKSSEHNRFDCGHELAHLAIHAHASPHGREAEQQADQFASAFLMPQNAIRSMAPSFANLGNLMKLKSYWGVSLSALIRRLKDLGLVSEWHYRSLNIDLARRGYHINEPQSMPRETSQVLSKVFDNLLREGITKHDIARDLKVLPGEIEGLVFRLATISIDGKGAGQKSAKPKPNLKIVT